MSNRSGIIKMEKEIRTFELQEFRVDTVDERPRIRGYAAVFDKKSEDLGGFREDIKPGAFAETLKKADVRALFNHDPNYVLGRNKSGTLSLAEDEKGLSIDIDPPDTQFARDLMVSINRGDINQMSFGFITKKDSWENLDDDSKRLRHLEEVELLDVSPVTFPAYPQTSVAVRNYVQEIKERPDPAVGKLKRKIKKLRLELTSKQ